jgi:pSer/pThr/pTyr-binding forkhead associated (FHA) protein
MDHELFKNKNGNFLVDVSIAWEKFPLRHGSNGTTVQGKTSFQVF